MKKVMLFGTFDILHKGHLNLFWQARKAGGYLIAVIARDETVKIVKKRAPKHNEKRRTRLIKKSGLADLVILGSLKDKYSAIKKYKPDLILLGYDQRDKDLEDKLKEFGLKTKIKKLKAYKPEIFKTSKLIQY